MAQKFLQICDKFQEIRDEIYLFIDGLMKEEGLRNGPIKDETMIDEIKKKLEKISQKTSAKFKEKYKEKVNIIIKPPDVIYVRNDHVLSWYGPKVDVSEIEKKMI